VRVALATCAELPDLDEDERLVIEPLRALGVNAEPAVWDDAGVDWDRFDLVIVRATWDYQYRRDAFLDWANALPAVLNPAPVLRWNTDKRYLAELAASGFPVVETVFAAPGERVVVPAAQRGEVVVKPSVSAGSKDTARYNAGDPRTEEHVARLHADGRTVMLQPYLGDVETAGETALLYLGGTYSHAIRKGPLLRPDGVMTDALFAPEEITPRAPSQAERGLADDIVRWSTRA
jgi:hypothetical protein